MGATKEVKPQANRMEIDGVMITANQALDFYSWFDSGWRTAERGEGLACCPGGNEPPDERNLCTLRIGLLGLDTGRL